MSRDTTAASAASAAGAGYRRATIVALLLCGLLTIVSLLVPPGLNFDPGVGMLEWRTLVEGGPANSIAAPDQTDISRDRTQFVINWSPGQYLVPGALTLLGLRLGPALSITAGLSLLCCLLGWIRVLKHFAVSPQTAMLAVAFLSAFLYSTVNFRIYYGGEILLQGVTPWLILAGCRVPVATALEAALLAGGTILIGFFLKLTGVLVALAALAAGSVVALRRLRRTTVSMFAGATGAILALGFLYAVWLSRGGVPASGDGFTARLGRAVFAVVAPWGAGVSWMDSLYLLHFLPRDMSLILPVLLPPVIFFASVILWGSRRMAECTEMNEFIKTTTSFYIFYALMVAILYLRGQVWDVDERYLRPAGTLIFICAIAVAGRLPGKHAVRLAAVAFCGFMSFYGLFSFVDRVRSVNPGEIDRYSQTRQLKVNAQSLEYARAAFAREGRDALFVLPFPDATSAFPPGARLISTSFDAEPAAFIAARKYAGRVPGHVYVLIRTRLARTSKAKLLLKEFTDYSADAWEEHQLGDTTVFVHAAPAS
jgi:hypothetical protein